MLISPVYAQGTTGSSDWLIQLVPLLVVWIVLLVFGLWIGKRKGSSVGRVIVGTIPIWGGVYLLWLASLTDKDVLERLAKLERGG